MPVVNATGLIYEDSVVKDNKYTDPDYDFRDPDYVHEPKSGSGYLWSGSYGTKPYVEGETESGLAPEDGSIRSIYDEDYDPKHYDSGGLLTQSSSDAQMDAGGEGADTTTTGVTWQYPDSSGATPIEASPDSPYNWNPNGTPYGDDYVTIQADGGDGGGDGDGGGFGGGTGSGDPTYTDIPGSGQDAVLNPNRFDPAYDPYANVYDPSKAPTYEGIDANDLEGYYEANFDDVSLQPRTVAEELDKLLASDSRYITAAKTRALQGMNARGVVNSSMATGAAEYAAIQAALPIAQQDADAYNQLLKDKNMGVISAELSRMDIQGRNQGIMLQGHIESTLANQQAHIASFLAANEYERKEMLIAQQGHWDYILQDLKGSQAVDLAQIEAAYKTMIQTSANANALQQALMNNIVSILGNKDIKGDLKEDYINQQINLFEKSLAMMSYFGGMDFSDLFPWAAPDGSTA